MKRFASFIIALACIGMLLAPTAQAESLGVLTTIRFIPGWNLAGNSNSASLDVPTSFGNADNISTVWKWNPIEARWAFYTPVQSDGGAAYAAANGFGALITVNAGEGFWVNAKDSFTVTLPPGASVTRAKFRNTHSQPNPLSAGWSLVSVGDHSSPSSFNNEIGASAPHTASPPNNLTTLWAWDSATSNWYFYAPSLDSLGTLASYVASKNYLSFSTKILDPTMGFWVHRPPSSGPPGSLDRSAEFVQTLVNLSDDAEAEKISHTVFLMRLGNLVSTIESDPSGPETFKRHLFDVVLGSSYPQQTSLISTGDRANQAIEEQTATLPKVIYTLQESPAYQAVIGMIQAVAAKGAAAEILEPGNTLPSTAAPEAVRAILRIDYKAQLWALCRTSAFTANYCVDALKNWNGGYPGQALRLAYQGAGRSIPSYLFAPPPSSGAGPAKNTAPSAITTVVEKISSAIGRVKCLVRFNSCENDCAKSSSLAKLKCRIACYTEFDDCF